MTLFRYSKIWQDPSARRYLGNLARTADIRRLLKLGFLAFKGKKKKTPKGLEKSLEAVLRRSIASSNGCQWPILPVLPLSHKGKPWTAIDLATKSWECRPETIDWSTRFADGEDSMALHRFGWILRGIERDHRVPWAVIAAWLDWNNRSQKDSRPKWVMDSYTVSERICNFTTLLILDPPQDKNLISLIRSQILEEALFLADHLEYYGHEGTNNHILNNARALIFAGTLSGNKGFFDCGLELLRHQLSYHCSTGGVFREASSHYQWVITRWMVEVALLLQGRGDSKFLLLKNWVGKMLDACDRLSLGTGNNRYIPRIGDVSPDFPPEWYEGMTTTARRLLENKLLPPSLPSERKGWVGLFGLPSEMKRPTPDLWISNRGDWMRFEGAGWSLLAHADREISDPRASHGHQDLLSFELAWKGIPIIIDRGRRDYCAPLPSREAAILDEWHNSVLVDRIRLGFSPRSFMDPEWLQQFRTKPHFESFSLGARLVLLQPKQLPHVSRIERGWSLEGEKLVMRTRVEGQGRHQIAWFLYTPLQTIRREGQTLRFSVTQDTEILLTGTERTTPTLEESEWYPAYGRTAAAMRISFLSDVNLPWTNELIFTPTKHPK